MSTLTASTMLVPSSKLKLSSYEDLHSFSFFTRSTSTSTLNNKKNNYSSSPVMRLFGPSIFEASKLSVLFLGVDKEKHPELPRTYTLTHSDINSNLTLAISRTINDSQLQGWYNKLQRDEVVAEWKKVKGEMSLHVHCHISGGHFLLDFLATFRYYIFCKELPVVLKAFVYGDEKLFNNYPELQDDAMVYVYFHSNLPEYNKVECWGLLKDAVSLASRKNSLEAEAYDHDQKLRYREEVDSTIEPEQPCKGTCTCCFPATSVMTWSQSVTGRRAS